MENDPKVLRKPVREHSHDVLKFDQSMIRRIDEVTKGVTDRDEYKRLSRSVQNDLYQKAAVVCQEQCCNHHNFEDTTSTGFRTIDLWTIRPIRYVIDKSK